MTNSNINSNENEDVIKKTSFNLFLLKKEIEQGNTELALKKIHEIDKELLKHFDIKFTEKTKLDILKYSKFLEK